MTLTEMPWNEWAERIVVHTPIYLDFDGSPSTGGRERHIRDFATLIRGTWGRQVTIVQMGHRDFETTCPDGFGVIGRRVALTDARGEPGLSWWLARRFVRRHDAVLYAAGERAWPFFAPRAKGIQHGIWWDGPLPVHKRLIQQARMLRFTAAMRSVLCVDTNYVNWLRTLGPRGLSLAPRCVYVPNYADTARLSVDPERAPHRPLRLLFARRFQPCRGPMLFLDTLEALKRRGFPFQATILSVGGHRELEHGIRNRGLTECTTLGAENLDGVLEHYATADVAVVPTVWSEGTSFAAVEALCAGVPVVCTPVGGLGNLIVPGHNGMIAAPHATDLALAIERLGDEATWRRTRLNALAMRPALGIERWRERALDWIRS